jgi:HD-GYP domain-containing protein (c-di-GMP phosphodiesterase class II)
MVLDRTNCAVFISASLNSGLQSLPEFRVHSLDFNEDITSYRMSGIHFAIVVLTTEEINLLGRRIWNELRTNPEINVKFLVVSNSNSQTELKDTYVLPSDLIFAILPTAVVKFQLDSILQSIFFYMDLEIKNVQLQSSLLINTQDIRRITSVGQALAIEHDFGKLIDMILLKARELTSSDGGSIYLAERPTSGEHATHLRFMRSVLLLDADEFSLPINAKSIAGYVALTKKHLIIDDVHKLPESAEYRYNSDFDKMHNYYTKSMMTIPMTNPSGDIIGVIQLINRKRNFNKKLTLEMMEGDEVISFSEKDYELVSSMAGQAAVAIDNQRLLQDQKVLLESFIQLIAGAIDSKSPYTGAHCERVPILTMMLADAACKAQDGVFRYFNLTETEQYELKIAAWLHDCGKVTTPVHVMDKATKLETIFDRIELVKARIEIFRREVEIEYLRSIQHLNGLGNKGQLEEEYSIKLSEIDRIEDLLVNTNYGTEFLADEVIEEIKNIGKIQITIAGKKADLLTKNEIENLCIRKGTLTDEERLIINGHMVETIKMLESLPFPSNLKRVPEYAGGHHEKLDGKGYPKGLYASDMSIPARIMAIADVFEALTAQDRPYKKGKTLSDTMKIMGYMKQDNHLDPDLLDLFITSGVYKEYASKFLPPDLIDEVNEQSILKIQPKQYNLPAKPDRDKRWIGFLPEYQNLLNSENNLFTFKHS